jgi:acyl-CoA thioesterase
VVTSISSSLGAVLGGVRPSGDGWAAFVPTDWAIGRTVFGGMQVALIRRAMRCAMEEAGPDAAVLPLRSLQATFVAPVPADSEVGLRAEILRKGRSVIHARSDLLHEGTLACTAIAIFGAPRPSQIAIEIPRPSTTVDPETLVDFPDVPGVTPEFTRHLQMRWMIGTPPLGGYDEPRSLIFARLRDTDCNPEEALIALADSIPTPALAMLKMQTRATSLNWMIELIGDPAALDVGRWSLIGTHVRAGADGYLSQTSILWGPDGHAFCVSHQSVAIFG